MGCDCINSCSWLFLLILLCADSYCSLVVAHVFDTYIGSSYMIQVVFCLYVYVEEKYSMAVVEFLL